MLRVYISGPITLGDRQKNIQQATEAAKQLIDAGHAPLCPHLSCYFPFADDVTHQQWLDVDLPWVSVSDALVRLPGESKGADMEVAHANSEMVPVFHSVESFLQWAAQ